MVAPVDTTYSHRFNTNSFVGYIDLPFDVNGELVPSIWNKWMANDITAIFSAAHGVFDSTALYFDAGASDDLGLNYHAQVFDGVATSFGVSHQFEIYPDMGGQYVADHTFLISDRLRKVAKFHSDAFTPIAPTN
jgi:hypothetical protein